MSTIKSSDLRDKFGTQWKWSWFTDVGWDRRMEIFYLMRSAYIGHVRQQVWPDKETGPDGATLQSHWVMGAPYYIHESVPGWPDSGFLGMMASQGVKFLFSTGQAYPGLGTSAYDPWFGAEVDLIDTIARRYRDVCVGIEAPNEYDNAGPTSPNVMQPWDQYLRDYINRVGWIWQGDGRVNNLPYVGPSLVHGESPGILGDLSGVLDAKNAHPYSGNRVYPASWAQAEKDRMVPVHGNQPIWGTEYGPRPGAGQPGGWAQIDERQAAVVLIKEYLTLLNEGFVRCYNYSLLDTQQGFGLLNNDLSERNTFKSVRKLLSLGDASPAPGTLGSLSQTLTGAPADLKITHAKNTDGSWLVFMWRESDLWVPPVTVHAKYPGKHNKVSYDLIGAGVDCPYTFSGDVEFDITIGDDPIAFKVS